MQLLPNIALIWLAVIAGRALALSPGSVPPEGRSLFDHLAIVKGPGGQYRYDLPSSFSQLVKTMIARANPQGIPTGQTFGSPFILLIPDGRSLQRGDADLKEPRRVIAFPDHFTAKIEVGFTLRDRLFLGHSPRKHQLEVISYNELAGRYEFQVVTNYGEGLIPVVRYSDRATCLRCHKAEAPIFAPPNWEESNAKDVLSAGIKWANDGATTLDDGMTPIAATTGLAYEINASVNRAAEWQFVQKVWQKGCRVLTPIPGAPSYKAEDCRAQLVIFALATLKNIRFANLVLPPVESATFLPFDQLKALVKSNFASKDIDFLIYQIPVRDRYKHFALPRDQASFQVLDSAIKESVAAGDHLPDLTVAADAPDRLPTDALRVDSDRYLSALRRLIGKLNELPTSDQLSFIRSRLPASTDPNAGASLMDLYLKLRKSDALGDRPLRRGALISAVLKSMKLPSDAAPPAIANSCCENYSDFPAMTFEDNSVVDGDISLERKLLLARCAACHSSQSSIGFLSQHQILSDRDLWKKIVSRELKVTQTVQGQSIRFEFCRRMNWSLKDLPATKRMPAVATSFAEMLELEQSTDVSERRILIEAYKANLLLALNDPQALSALLLEHPTLRLLSSNHEIVRNKVIQALQASEDCRWTPFTGEAQ